MTAVTCSTCGGKTTLVDDLRVCVRPNCPGHQEPPIQVDFDALSRWTPYKPATADDDEDRGDWWHR
jgi:hypothetical protein